MSLGSLYVYIAVFVADLEWPGKSKEFVSDSFINSSNDSGKKFS